MSDWLETNGKPENTLPEPEVVDATVPFRASCLGVPRAAVELLSIQMEGLNGMIDSILEHQDNVSKLYRDSVLDEFRRRLVAASLFTISAANFLCNAFLDGDGNAVDYPHATKAEQS